MRLNPADRLPTREVGRKTTRPQRRHAGREGQTRLGNITSVQIVSGDIGHSYGPFAFNQF
jgi:hypothetical protein